jgi:hypothetical protein
MTVNHTTRALDEPGLSGILSAMKSFVIRLAALTGLLTLTWAAYTQAPPPAPFVLHKVAEDLFVIDGGGAGNVAVYVAGEGAVLVDDKFDRSFAGELK